MATVATLAEHVQNMVTMVTHELRMQGKADEDWIFEKEFVCNLWQRSGVPDDMVKNHESLLDKHEALLKTYYEAQVAVASCEFPQGAQTEGRKADNFQNFQKWQERLTAVTQDLVCSQVNVKQNAGAVRAKLFEMLTLPPC